MQPLCSPFFFDYTHPPLNPTSSPAISWCRPKFPPPAPPLSGHRSPTITCNSSITCKHPPFISCLRHTYTTRTPWFLPATRRTERERSGIDTEDQSERERGGTR
ncbi:hypothetical protein HanPI659440_Chr12g0450501 [Helianthus annuus]|nr:hypothetical protein HanPI659440_Chr12g0450501 [Helianthus annuus]